jgi:hypothetical protein
MLGTIVGEKEIAERLRVPVNTVHQWAKRGLLPTAEGTVSGAPAWHWGTVESWARSTGRMPGLREAIVELVLRVGPTQIAPVAKSLIECGFARSLGHVQRTMTDLVHEGLLGIGLGNEWHLTDLGRTVGETRRRGQGGRSESRVVEAGL